MQPDGAVGWDIGGAHLKAAVLDSSGSQCRVAQVPCPLWRGMEQLDGALEEAWRVLAPGEGAMHALTMTGELCDLFADRTEGVTRIVERAAQRLGRAWVYAGRRGLVDAAAVGGNAAQVASANWLAAAQCVAAEHEDALYVDIGSTTADILRVRGGEVCILGASDHERLRSGELLYTGVVRTPLVALGDSVSFRGADVPLMAEYFATTADVYRLTGDLPGHADQCASADGQAKDASGSARRLARMIGLDLDDASLDEWRELASRFAQLQQRKIERACERMYAPAGTARTGRLVAAGVGRFLAQRVAQRLGLHYVQFGARYAASTDTWSPADCAPAVAVAQLALKLV